MSNKFSVQSPQNSDNLTVFLFSINCYELHESIIVTYRRFCNIHSEGMLRSATVKSYSRAIYFKYYFPISKHIWPHFPHNYSLSQPYIRLQFAVLAVTLLPAPGSPRPPRAGAVSFPRTSSHGGLVIMCLLGVCLWISISYVGSGSNITRLETGLLCFISC